MVKVMKENINALNELNKGAKMGEDAVNVILDKIKEKKLKSIVTSLLEEYKKTLKNVEAIYNDYSKGEAKETSLMNKIMTKKAIEMNLSMDENDSKIAEILIQGIDMGIIEGRRMLNNKNIDKTIHKLIDDYVSYQEKYLDTLKGFL